jgi:hypothetical protein
MNPLYFTVLPDEDRQVDLKKDFLDNFPPLPGVVGNIVAHGIQNVTLPMYQSYPTPFLPSGLKGVLVIDAKQQLRGSVYAWGESGEYAKNALPDNFHSLSLTEKVDRLSSCLVAYYDSPSMSKVLPSVILETLPKNKMDPARAALYIIPKLAQDTEVKLSAKDLELESYIWLFNMDLGADHSLCGIGEYIEIITQGDLSDTETVKELLDVPVQYGLAAACEGMVHAVWMCGATNDGIETIPQIAMEYEGEGLTDKPPMPNRRSIAHR